VGHSSQHCRVGARLREGVDAATDVSTEEPDTDAVGDRRQPFSAER
jgi:hypothetical protein